MARRTNGEEYEVGPLPVVLSCHHAPLFRPPYPRLRDVMWCNRCLKTVRVVSIADTYGVTCKGCRFARRYGTDLDAARRAASKHVLRYQAHTCEIHKSGELLERVTNAGADNELPFAQVLGKRATQVAQSQAKLKEMTERLIDKRTPSGNVEDVQPTPFHQEET